jgi:hypothetical protein
MSVANAWCFGAKRTNEEYLEATKTEVASANHLLGLQSQALTLLQVASLNSRVALERKDENSELKPNGDVRCYDGDDDDNDGDDINNDSDSDDDQVIVVVDDDDEFHTIVLMLFFTFSHYICFLFIFFHM